jgi:FO synthase
VSVDPTTTGSPGSAGLRAALRRAERGPAELDDAGYVALLGADGDDLDRLCRLADTVRAAAVGDEITFVVNRNLDTAVVGTPDPAATRLLDALVDEAWALGATEICLQGPLPPGAPDDGYLRLIRAIHARAPGIHLHAFRPAEIADGAARLGIGVREFLVAARDAGLGSVPGTAARILDDEIRAALLGRPDLPVARWIELITTAHEVGLGSTATMIYGHVETPADQVAHLRTLARIQDRTGGFSEFIAMPYLPEAAAPVRSRPVRPGPSARETRAVHAVARLLLAGRIDHVQVAWTKLAPPLVRQLLAGGADDAGGLLLDGTIDPGAGAEAGRTLRIGDVEALAAGLGRGVRQRTTRYTDPTPERLAAARRAGAVRVG